MSTQHLFRAFLVVIPTLLGAAPGALGKELPKGTSEGKLDKLEFLDISIAKGWAAFTLVAHLEPGGGADAPKTFNCGYPGMDADNLSGVVVKTWNLREEKEGTRWVLYEKGALKRADCSSQEMSTNNLIAATITMAEVGLDPKRKPAPLAPVKNVFTLPFAGKEVTVDSTTRTERNEEAKSATVTLSFTSGGRTLYEGSQQYALQGGWIGGPSGCPEVGAAGSCRRRASEPGSGGVDGREVWGNEHGERLGVGGESVGTGAEPRLGARPPS